MKLNKEFDSISKQDWEAKLFKELKIISPDALKWRINEHIDVLPAYFKTEKLDIRASPGEKANNNWIIGDSFKVANYKAINKKLLIALSGGLEGIELNFNKVPKFKDWEILFNKIELSFIELHLSFGNKVEAIELIQSLHKFLIEQKIPTKKIKGSIHLPRAIGAYKTLCILCHQFFPNMKSIVVDVRTKNPKIQDSDKELASVLTQLEEIIFALRAQGISLNFISQKICLKNSIGQNFFLAIAKIRAQRILIQNLFWAYKSKQEIEIPIIAYSNQAHYVPDQNNNKIRSTVQAMSAAIAGADCIILNSTKKRGHTDFTRRIARNVQHLMKMESSMEIVLDPASGSYFLDQLTSKLMCSAWSKFSAKYK